MALNFSEWSREEKDDFAQKRMEEMKLKNEALKQRYAEVEQDRIKAEAKDSAVTSLKILKKENSVIDRDNWPDIPKVTKEREWDKGKVDQDDDDWDPPKFYGYRSRAQRRNFPDRRAPKKEDNWRVRSANVSKDRQSYSKFRSYGPNHKQQESSNYGTSGYRNENASFSRQRGRSQRTASGTYRSFHNSKFDEHKKKSISGGAGSISPSLSDSELEPIKYQVKPETDRMWHNEGVTINHKQSRVERWVKAINMANSWNEEYDNVNDYCEEGGPRDSTMSYGYGNDEEYPKKVHSSRDQAQLKNRERYDGSKYGQSSRGNSRARGCKTQTGERSTGGFENKNQRDLKKRNYSDKNRFRRESDLSDRTSSMKESDYHDCCKDKFNKTASDSKSSDYSGLCEDEEYNAKYASEKRPFDKQSSARNYGKDKINKPKNVRTSSVSSNQDGMKKDDFDVEYDLDTRQKFPNSSIKAKSKSKNSRTADHGGFDDQHADGAGNVDNSFSKVKSNKYNSESKSGGHFEKLENENATNYHAKASRPHKMSKPSPKRVLSNPVKSVDTSSSASKTLEVNSPDEYAWGDNVDSGLTGNLEGNKDNEIKCKNSLMEENAEVKKTRFPIFKLLKGTDWSASSETSFFKNSRLEDDEESGDAVNDLDDSNAEVSISSEDSAGRNDNDINSANMSEDQKLVQNLEYYKDGINVEYVSRCNTSEIEIDGAADNCNVMTDEYDDGNGNVGDSGDQYKVEIKGKQPVFAVVNNAVESCENKNPTAIVVNENNYPLSEVSLPEVLNSQRKAVQLTETEEGGREDSLNNANYETPPEQTVETAHIEKETLSSQNMKVACTKDDFVSTSKLSDHITAQPQSFKHEGNYIENKSSALNLSDDGGWSTVSEDEKQ